jgi:hypothetical protein
MHEATAHNAARSLSVDGRRALALGAISLVLACAGSGCHEDAAATRKDAAVVEAGTIDAAREDAGHDASVRLDAAHADAASDAYVAVDAALDAGDDEDAGPGLPTSLDETGLYSDFGNETLANGIVEFTPRFTLYSDGATKRRFLYLPPGTTIDTSNMDAWVFPVGTKAWKEFTRDGVRVETRLLHKTEAGWFTMAFGWNEAQTEAVQIPFGQHDANGTQHDIPSAADCRGCHNGSADVLLGVSAVQLSHDDGTINLMALASAGRLSDPPAQAFASPGSSEAQAAFGALHANCGHCHNPRGIGFDRAPGMKLWLEVAGLTDETTTTIYQTTVDQPLVSRTVPGATLRIAKMAPTASGLLMRLQAPRRSELGMPPLATELPDSATESAVTSWINTLQ